ncbi:VirB3 family type IV secretion system protein [Chromobacterium vaccinii]|uniref:VirB3 family type IV secretion system protein n=1 Tax=Chromobacterium vaccinii TaxID=1108595 RepID=UPI00345B1769
MQEHEDDRPDQGELLVVAMTRPSMIGGWTLSSLFISFYLPGLLALVLRDPLPTALIPILLLVCWMICLKDVYLFDIAQAAAKLRRSPNSRYWGCRSYAPR